MTKLNKKQLNIEFNRKNTQYYKVNGMELSLGNDKLPDNTLILNMGSAKTCPSWKLGLCKVKCPITGKKECYALQPELMRPKVKAYRDRQEVYWKNTDKYQIVKDFETILNKHRKRINGKLIPLHKYVKYFRFNESGDFWSQDCIEKLDYLAAALKKYAIKTYGYTAREDLDFSKVEHFRVKGSSNTAGNNGITTTLKMSEIEAKINKFNKVTISREFGRHEFKVCPMDCSVCGMCKNNRKINIVFPLH